MKKSILTVFVAAALTTGCATSGSSEAVSYNTLQTKGQELYTQSVVDGGTYEPSLIEDVEIIRTAVNTAFLAAKPAYENYVSQLMNEPVLGNYFSAVEAAESDEDKRSVYDALTMEDRKVIDDFNSSTMGNEIMGSLGDAAKVALKNIAMFKSMNTSDMISGVGFKELMSEKNKLALTVEQIDYLNDTIISAYTNYQVVSAFRSAQ